MVEPANALAAGLIELIRSSPGGLLPAERKLADQFTVTRHAVRETIERLAASGRLRKLGRGWTIAESAPSLSAGALIVLSDIRDHGHHQQPGGYHERIVAGAVAAAESWSAQFGHPLLCLHRPAIDVATMQQVIAAQPSGVVVIARERSAEVHAALRCAVTYGSFAVAAYEAAEDAPEVDTVWSDHAAGCAALVTWLAARGCRRIVRTWDVTGRRWLAERDRGYLSACAAAHLVPLPALSQLMPLFHEGAHDRTTFDRQIDALAGALAPLLTSSEPPDALLAASDRHALALIGACARFHHRPPPLVCGYDDFWRIDPQSAWVSGAPAASIDKGNLDTGRALVELLVERLNGTATHAPRHVLIAPRLVPGDG